MTEITPLLILAKHIRIQYLLYKNRKYKLGKHGQSDIEHPAVDALYCPS